MRRTVLPLALALAACRGGSTGDDTDAGDGEGPFGAWRVEAPPVDDGLLRHGTTWLHLGDDGLLQALSTTPRGFHGSTEAPFTVTGDQLVVDDADGHAYTWSVDDDELVLSRDGVDTAFLRNDGAPTIDAWLPEATVTGGFELDGADATDLGWDGAYLWIGNGVTGTQLKRLDPTTGEVVAALNTGLDVVGIDSDGTDLWCSSGVDDEIARVSGSTGGIVQGSPTMGARVDGIAWDGARVWVHSDEEDTLYRYAPDTEEVEAVLALAGEGVDLTGLAAIGGDLLAGDGDTVHRLSTTSLQARGSWRVSGLARITGVASDGARTWALGADDDDRTRVVEVTLP